MRIVSEEQVETLGITPRQCVKWVEESFRQKFRADMPAKISVHPFPDSFYTAMPCYHPDLERVGVKIVSRIPGRTPSLKSKIFLYDAKSGDALALIDSNWITAMRTGAVAALAAKTFSRNFDSGTYGFVGLGVVGRATIQSLLAICRKPKIWLLDYKDHVKKIANSFPGVKFYSTSNKVELIQKTDALISCVTVMHDQFLPAELYPEGYTLIPVHVRGFQDCDLVFDKIYGDDTEQLKGFKNFTKFKKFAEFSDVLLGTCEGRVNDSERIISYNYGLALHDLWFASRIYDMVSKS